MPHLADVRLWVKVVIAVAIIAIVGPGTFYHYLRHILDVKGIGALIVLAFAGIRSARRRLGAGRGRPAELPGTEQRQLYAPGQSSKHVWGRRP